MKVQLTMDKFPMLLVDMMVADLRKYLDRFDIQVGGDSTVFVTFATDDAVKAQAALVICDKYAFGDGSDGSQILHRDEE